MAQEQQTQQKSSISKYLIPLILVVMPVAIALGQDTTISGIIPAMTGSAYPIAFTLLSWGIAAKLIHDSRK
jgi:hypothetical protein